MSDTRRCKANPPPDKSFPQKDCGAWVAMNVFVGHVVPDPISKLASVLATLYLDDDREYFRFTLPVTHPIVLEYLERQHLPVPGLGPLTLSGTWVGEDSNPELEDASHPATRVLSYVELTRPTKGKP